MNLAEIGGALRSGIKSNESLILSVGAGFGALTTAYLAARASFEAASIIRREEQRNDPVSDPRVRFKNRTKLVWKLYVPTAISATATIACIFGANRVAINETLAAKSAFDLLQAQTSEYRDKVVEQFGARKEQAVRDSLAEDRVKKDPPPPQSVILDGPGNVLCCELYTRRYFTSDMESMRRAQNDLNTRLIAHDYATLDDFYYLIGLSQTSHSGNMGWQSNKLMELEFSTVLTEDGRPCLAFEYNYLKPL